MKTGLLIVGLKGLEFIKNISFVPESIVSYKDKNVNDGSYESIVEWCKSKSITYVDRKDLTNELDEMDKILVVGWQYLLKGSLDKYIIFHDSYLPFSRGFAPTVSALIRGDLMLGATAFQPTDEVDYGKMYVRRKIPIEYPLKIKDAFKIISKECAEMANEIVLDGRNDNVYPNKDRSTFSIWRDREDMFIDWNDSASKIKRVVDALGNPYSGALTTYDGRVIIVSDAENVEDIDFNDNHAGKTWELKDNEPTIICGDGMIKIKYAMYEDTKEKVDFKYLRKRFG